jgi:molybdopterin converting factor small subunit
MTSRVTVLIASPLRPYTGAGMVEASGGNVGELLDDLDARFPGLRFRMVDEQDRIRKHIRLFVNGTQVKDLASAIRPADEICIVQALSGG